MLHLHHADRLEPLLDALADLLAVPPADPFEADVVAVPAVGIRDAAMVGLGRRLGVSTPGSGDGIWANVEFLFPGRFMARAIGDSTRDGEPELDPWRLPRLTWAVLEELAAGTVEVPGSDVEGRWALARHIADLFDRYATQRARLVECWADGIDSDGTYRDDGAPAPLDPSQQWQAELWRAVHARIGTPSPPERLPALLQSIADGSVRPNLPGRVAVFGVGALAPTMQQVLVALAAQREVHVFLRHPSMLAWQHSPHRLAGGLNVRANLDVTIAAKHPLLASWGRPALESRALLHGLPGVVDVAHQVVSPAPATLLGAVQHSIRVDIAPAATGLVADGSLQVHACHGEVRQLEVLRDALGRAFVDDPTLQPHEVLVLCPALDRFGPLVEAVFAQGALPVPVRVGDRSLTTDEPIVQALQAALALVSGRATLSEVLALVQLEPVRRRFGWSIEQVEQMAEWSEQLGARWGLLPHHRTAWGLPGDLAAGTWRLVVDGLLAGVAMAAPVPRLVIGGVAPFDDLDTDDAALAGSLADLLARLVDLHDAVQGERPVATWIELLHRTVDEFTDPGDDPGRRQQVHRELTDVVRAATSPVGTAAGQPTPCAVPLALADVRALLGDTLAERPGRLPLRSGSVTVSSLVPQHGVPARVVCLLGLDDGSLRAGTFDGDDILGLRPCVGERHPRHESRQLLLDALLSAGERCIITCNGADLTTNKELPFIVPVVELLETVGSFGGSELRLSEQVVVRHPRHGFDERALQPHVLPADAAHPFTFDTAMLAAAQARRAARSADTAPVTSPWLLSPVPFDAVDLDDLVEVAGNPARTYLQRRLDVSMPEEASVADDGLAISVTPLGTSSLGRDLLAVRRLGGPADEWEATARLDGALPPGQLSTAVLSSVRAEVEAFEESARDWDIPLIGGSELLIDVATPVTLYDRPVELSVRGKVVGVVPGPDGPRVVDLRFARPRPSFRLALALRVATAQLHEPAHDWSGVLITRAAESGRKVLTSTTGLRIRGEGSQRTQHAHELVGMAAQLLAWARRDAVPFLDRTSYPLALGDLGAAYEQLDKDLGDRFQALLWPGLSIEALQRDPVLPTDPPQVQAIAAHGSMGRGEAVATWVWRVFDECVDLLDAGGATVRDDPEGDE